MGSVMHKLIVTALGVWLVNAVIAKSTGYSPLYCLGGYVVGPVWREWSQMAFLLSLGFFVYAMFTSWLSVPVAVLAMMVVGALPEFSRIVLGGGSCQ